MKAAGKGARGAVGLVDQPIAAMAAKIVKGAQLSIASADDQDRGAQDLQPADEEITRIRNCFSSADL